MMPMSPRYYIAAVHYECEIATLENILVPFCTSTRLDADMACLGTPFVTRQYVKAAPRGRVRRARCSMMLLLLVPDENQLRKRGLWIAKY
jgi:hypothetical protein